MLLAWLQMRNCGGAFVLRLENLDPPRERPGAEDATYEDLRWLHFDWDEGPDIGGPFAPYRQIERRELYDAAIHSLRDDCYACACTRREVESQRGPATGGEQPYPGTCRARTVDPGAPCSVRFRVDPGPVTWHDGVLGPVTQDPSQICGDFIVRAKGGGDVYQLAVVVDDLAMGITDVLRGEDLVESTSRQLLLWRRLGAREPRFSHVPLRRGADGHRLAKSRGSPALRDLRAGGVAPERVIGQLAFELGLRPDDAPCRPLDLVGSVGPWACLDPSQSGGAAPP